MKKKLRKELNALHLGRIAAGNPDYDIWFYQKRPYTMVQLRYNLDSYIAFTKACWPDDWNAEFGKELALKKAVADLVEHQSAK